MFLQKTAVVVFLLFVLIEARSLAPTVRNLQARYDAQQDAIFVTWNGPSSEDRTGKGIVIITYCSRF
jgi:hypothetical protein